MEIDNMVNIMCKYGSFPKFVTSLTLPLYWTFNTLAYIVPTHNLPPYPPIPSCIQQHLQNHLNDYPGAYVICGLKQNTNIFYLIENIRYTCEGITAEWATCHRNDKYKYF